MQWRIVTDAEVNHYLIPHDVKQEEFERWEEWCDLPDDEREPWDGDYWFPDYAIGDTLQDIIFEKPENDQWVPCFTPDCIPDAHAALIPSQENNDA